MMQKAENETNKSIEKELRQVKDSRPALEPFRWDAWKTILAVYVDLGKQIAGRPLISISRILLFTALVAIALSYFRFPGSLSYQQLIAIEQMDAPEWISRRASAEILNRMYRSKPRSFVEQELTKELRTEQQAKRVTDQSIRLRKRLTAVSLLPD